MNIKVFKICLLLMRDENKMGMDVFMYIVNRMDWLNYVLIKGNVNKLYFL